MSLSKTISTALLSLATTSLLFSTLPASAKNKEPWVFISCSGTERVTYDTEKNIAIFSGIFYNSEERRFSEGTIESSFGKYRRAHYPKFNESKCYYWGYETERKAKDAMNDSIADSKNNEFKIIRTGFEY